MPKRLRRLSIPMLDPVRATITDRGVTTTLVSVPYRPSWIVDLCHALVAAGVDPARGIIARYWDRSSAVTVMEIAGTLAFVVPHRAPPAQHAIDFGALQ